MENKNVIIKVEDGSIAKELNIQPGDILISIDNKEVKDVFDYRYLIKNEYIEVFIKKNNDEEVIFEVEKDYEEDLGIVFWQGMMDNAKSCKNNCIFCFIDQLPKGMRDTLYFKDDDSRLSFLQGNYVTLTNMSDEDIDRLIFYHLSPINISVHTTDLDLRHFMLKNPKSKNLLKNLDKLHKASITMNFQIVLVKGVNDKDNLDKTIMDLSKYIKNEESLSIVPIGITKFRKGLYFAEEFTKDDCVDIVNQVEKHQKFFLEKYNTRFVYASDEFYIMAEIKLPTIENYENFPQHENGVGMITLMEDEFYNHLKTFKKNSLITKDVSIVTGVLAYDFIQKLVSEVALKFPNVNIKVYKVVNDFFGKEITVSGLLTGVDIINQLKDKDLGDKVLIPESAFKLNEMIFLDDMNIYDLEEEFNTKVEKVKTNGIDFIDSIIN